VKEILIELTKSETKHRDEKISGIPQKTKKKANSQKRFYNLKSTILVT
jgi:hypothetical protein